MGISQVETLNGCKGKVFVDRLREVLVITRSKKLELYSPPTLPEHTKIIIKSPHERPVYVQTTENSIVVTVGAFFLKEKPIENFPFTCSTITMSENEDAIIVTAHDYSRWYGKLAIEYKSHRIYTNHRPFLDKINLLDLISRIQYKGTYLPKILAGWLK